MFRALVWSMGLTLGLLVAPAALPAFEPVSPAGEASACIQVYPYSELCNPRRAVGKILADPTCNPFVDVCP